MTKPITRKEFNELQRLARDCMRLASTHDPDHEKRLTEIEKIICRWQPKILAMPAPRKRK